MEDHLIFDSWKFREFRGKTSYIQKLDFNLSKLYEIKARSCWTRDVRTLDKFSEISKSKNEDIWFKKV